MRIAFKRRPAPSLRPELVEVVTPRTNAATITATENLFAALATGASSSAVEPFALELAATQEARWFLARAMSPAMRRRLEEQLGAAYPQAELRRLDLEQFPGLDPARLRAGEQAAVCDLTVSAPTYLPLRTFRDVEVSADSQADPLLGLLGAMSGLPEGWRALAQLACLRPASDDWGRSFVRFAVEHPLAAERAAGREGASLTSVVLMGGALAAGAVALQGYQWYDAGAWLPLGLLAGGVSAGLPGLVWLAQRLGQRPLYDPRLVQEKLSRSAHVCRLRLAVFAPQDAAADDVEERLARLVSAYRQYTLAAGNGLVRRGRRAQAADLSTLDAAASARLGMVLNCRELAGLWHLPQHGADVPLVERTTARRYLPRPYSVAQGCPIGQSSEQGKTIPVALPPDLLRRHLLLVAKTRRGKSSLLLQIARFLIEQSGTTARRRQCLVLVDPHGDLAQGALGLIPPSRQDDVVYLDVAQQERPFGLNLLDVGLGWDRDQAVANALTIFRREFDRFWGPRMEDAFRFALLTLVEANQAMCAAEPDGRGRQHTILEVPAVLANPGFRGTVLARVADPVVKHWWTGYFDSLDRRLQVEIINPVQTKVQRFAGSRAARAVVGQPASTIDPIAWLEQGAVVVINTAKGIVGEDTAALVGGTLLNLVALAVARQAGQTLDQRHAVTLLVDEFHTMPGADYEAILSELSKYGANLVLATQSLARLEALDRQHDRALRATVFANLDGLFAFNTSAEDARYLVRELGNEVDEQDLVALGDYQCYARWSSGGERLPVFWAQLDPPPPGDRGLAQRIVAASAARYGRDGHLVEAELAATLQRIDQARLKQIGHPAMASPAAGAKGPPPGPDHQNAQQEPPTVSKARNEGRPARTKPSPLQGEFTVVADTITVSERGAVPDDHAEGSRREFTEGGLEGEA